MGNSVPGGGSPRWGCGEDVGQVVKGRAEVMEKLAYEDTEPSGNFFSRFDGEDEVDFAGRAKIILSDNAVWLAVEEPLNFALDGVQVFVRPV